MENNEDYGSKQIIYLLSHPKKLLITIGKTATRKSKLKLKSIKKLQPINHQ